MSRRALLLMAVVFSGCEPGAELLINGRRFSAALDFGSLEFERTGERGIGVENRGDRTWTLRSVTHLSGAAVRWLPELEEPRPIFTLQTVLRTVRPGVEQGLLRVIADPPELREDAQYDAAVGLEFLAQDGAQARVDVSLHAVALSFPCAYPTQAFDFGEVVVGARLALAYTLKSNRPFPDVATLVPSAGFSDVFSLEAERIVLDPFQEHVTHLAFSPPAVGSWESSLELSPSALCEAQTIRVSGRGVPAGP